VSLLVLPAIINLQTDDNAARFAIAGVSALVLIAAIIYSSRRTEGIHVTSTPAAPAPQIEATVG
jgi:hypothetical protein